MKHTPGPWIHDTRGYPHADVKAVSGRKVACTWGINSSTPKSKAAYEKRVAEGRANARLIAEAPALLEMLRVSVIVLEKVEPSGDPASDEVLALTIQTAKAAIAKATGEET